MLKKSLNTSELLDTDQPNILLGVAGTIGTGTNLQRAEAVILCECLYNPKLAKKIFERPHRLGQKNNIHYHIVYAISGFALTPTVYQSTHKLPKNSRSAFNYATCSYFRSHSLHPHQSFITKT